MSAPEWLAERVALRTTTAWLSRDGQTCIPDEHLRAALHLSRTQDWGCHVLVDVLMDGTIVLRPVRQ